MFSVVQSDPCKTYVLHYFFVFGLEFFRLSSSTTVDVGLESNGTDINNKHIHLVLFLTTNILDYLLIKLLNCYKDYKCRIFYHHVQKTGGTFLCDALSPYFNNGEKYDASIYGVASVGFMDKFRKNPASYCKGVTSTFSPLKCLGMK